MLLCWLARGNRGWMESLVLGPPTRMDDLGLIPDSPGYGPQAQLILLGLETGDLCPPGVGQELAKENPCWPNTAKLENRCRIDG